MVLAQGLRHRLAVGEFPGVDTGAVQDQRQKMADAAVLIDDVADRDTARRTGSVGRAVVGCVGRSALQSVSHRRRPWAGQNQKTFAVDTCSRLNMGCGSTFCAH
jgi:hypothetical protein